MELSYYSDMAVRLVNTEQPERGEDTLTSVDEVRELCGAGTMLARRTTETDVSRLRAVRTRLRAVFRAAAEGDQKRAVDLLNSLLMEYPTSPQISGHGHAGEDSGPRWHMHLAEQATTTTAGYTATACMGLAFHLTALGAERLGVCQAGPCRNAYLDTSTNRSRRYCSDRCATRANVAAYRARKRREGGAAPSRSPARDRSRSRTSGRTADTAQPASESTDG